MFVINSNSNRIEPLEKPSFTELGFKEVAHLQEWLANHPAAFDESLLIIQKEFDGFNDTYERLDLLALDLNGNLVIIENKLDDTGRDVVWQALKYASYCSTLRQDQIVRIYQDYLDKWEPGAIAREKLESFFPFGTYDLIEWNNQQRMILVAAHFRKEVPSTVLWLMNHKIRIQCFKTEPFRYRDLLFLKLDQIIPTKDTEDYVIKMADKVQDVQSRKEELSYRHVIRLEFWGQLLPIVKGKMPVFQSNIATKDNVLYAGGTDLTSVSYVFTITGNYCSVGLIIGRTSKEENKAIFDYLYSVRCDIEKTFGDQIIWERQPDNIRSLIAVKFEGVDVFNKDHWPRMFEFMLDRMSRLEQSLRKPLMYVKANIKDLFLGISEKPSIDILNP